MNLIFVATHEQSKYLPYEYRSAYADVLLTPLMRTKEARFHMWPTITLHEGQYYPIVKVFTTGESVLEGEVWRDVNGEILKLIQKNTIVNYDTFDKYELADGSQAIIPTHKTEVSFKNVRSLGLKYNALISSCAFSGFIQKELK